MEGSAVALDGYKARKAAQVAAFFAIKSGGTVNVLKLMKLMYLSEREFISRYDVPMLFDRLVSMKNGPMCVPISKIKSGIKYDDACVIPANSGSSLFGVGSTR